MYICYVLINALSAHIAHINLNMILYTHVEHSPTIKKFRKVLQVKTFCVDSCSVTSATWWCPTSWLCFCPCSPSPPCWLWSEPSCRPSNGPRHPPARPAALRPGSRHLCVLGSARPNTGSDARGRTGRQKIPSPAFFVDRLLKERGTATSGEKFMFICYPHTYCSEPWRVRHASNVIISGGGGGGGIEYVCVGVRVDGNEAMLGPSWWLLMNTVVKAGSFNIVSY